jgi:hypothetical protein
MVVTKDNAVQILIDLLRTNKVNYTINDHSGEYFYMNLHVGSYECGIQVEFGEGDNVLFNFHTKIDNNGLSLYQRIIEGYGEEIITLDMVEGELLTLVDEGKKYSRVISKIEAKIEQIKDLCTENDLNIDDFIRIEFDFE